MLCLLTIATLLAACGQKGPLYLPGENRSAAQPPSTAWYCASTPEQPHCGGS
ncbi:MAG: lipoprotein [Gammaproteobacteria bacterium]